MEDFLPLARSIAGGMRETMLELNAKEVTRCEQLIAQLTTHLAAPEAAKTPQALVADYVRLQVARANAEDITAILTAPEYMAHASAMVSAHKVETLRGLITRLKVSATQLATEIETASEEVAMAGSEQTYALDTLQTIARETPAAAPLVARWMPTEAAREFVWSWAAANLGDPISVSPALPGPDAVFDSRGILDAIFMTEHDYDKMGEELGLCPAILARMNTINIGTASEPDGFVLTRESATATTPLKPWDAARIGTLKRVGALTMSVSEANNKSLFTPDALIEMQTKASQAARANREHHKGVQREQVYTMRDPLDSMKIESLQDLGRYAIVRAYFDVLHNMRKPHRIAVSLLLEHKQFSGTDTPLSEVYEKQAARVQGTAEFEEWLSGATNEY